MNYELAKQLLDKGFKMNKALPDSTTVWGSSDTQGTYYEYPSLSELIEACGDLMPSVRLFCNFARKEYGTQAQMQGLEDVAWYSTPEEAVATLWLALNAQKN
jgi:hypothetical protein